MSIVDPDIDGAAAYCPHCSAPVGEGVFPWPPDPTRCPACGEWIGRNRAEAQPVGAAAAVPDEETGGEEGAIAESGGAEIGRAESGRAPGRKPQSRFISFLLGRRPDAAEASVDEPHQEAPSYGEPPLAAEREEPLPAEEEPPAAREEEPPSAAEREGVRGLRDGAAGRMRELRSRIGKSGLLPSGKPAADDAEPTTVDEDEAAVVEEPDLASVEEDAPPVAEAEHVAAAEVEAEEPAAEVEEELEEPAAEVEAEEPVAEVEDDEPPAVEEQELAEIDEEPAAATEDEEQEVAVAAVEDEVEEPPTAPEPPEPAHGRELDLRTVAARVAVSRMASGTPKTSRLPAIARPQKLQPPRIGLPRTRPATPRRPAPKPTPLTEGGKRQRRPMRITGVSMVVIGLLILAYGTVTLVWQDPWTAWQTAQAQKRAKVQFDRIVKDFRKSARNQTKVATRDWLHRQAALFNLNTPEGSPVGRLSIPKIGIHFTIVQGTEESTLQKGPAHYVETPLPGAKGKWTVGIAGHRTTYLAPFRHIDELRPGDSVTIQMPYARFTYAVEKTRIVDATNQTVLAADSAITDRKPYNRLALTACHPPFSAAQRIIVYAKLIRYKVPKAQS